ncbi:AraC family transcriptional regulator [Aestuariicella sp. G3-2]|uniref:AraC family transcriptional regulator n=1 Tax=Pseudomaricurvus albidus TaxID=2842452 RepID=UPI001C0C2D67|nr:AraC family transcriptional regulator [Aestuariicella albida]MBU3071750.1 AraC family transcriptional regulator [Aestuariicella albida]
MNIAESWVLRLLSRTGVSIDLLCRDAGDLVGEFLSHQEEDVPVDLALELFSESEKQIDDPDLGVHLGENMNLNDIGLYGYLLLNAHTLGELLEFASHYFNILFHTSKVYLHKDADNSIFEYRIIKPTKNPPRHDIDWSLGTYIKAVRNAIGDHWSPDSVSLSYGQPSKTDELTRVYGDKILFSQKTNSFTIDSTLLDIPINDSDTELLKIIKVQADQLVQAWVKGDDFYHRVRLMIMQGLSEDRFNADILARRMGMSLSSLKRRLSELNMSFREIRDELIDSLAKQALKDTRLPISAIALQLGYSESAAFDRAFKRLAGMSPREYRKKIQF